MKRGVRIHVLPSDVADRIAAGEVVERPASVVKELVENSLDAGAKRVVVELKDGGRRLIRVTDDGHGMTHEEAELALQRHATSKIRRAEDLLAVGTLGFRGEALPSIAAVSRLELVTRDPDDAFGCRLLVEGGHIVTRERVGTPSGTSVSVSNLFFNTPARRQQLRPASTELARIVEILQGLALGHPHVAIVLEHEGRRLLQTPGDGDVLGAAAAALGVEMARNLLSSRLDAPGVGRVEVYAGRPAIARATRQLQFYIVNGRPVRSDALREAVEREYRGLLPLHRYPVIIVRLDLPPGTVDVNVHPSKQTVRFVDPRGIAEVVRAGVHQALRSADLAPRVRLRGPERPSASPLTTGVERQGDAVGNPRVPLATPPARPTGRLREDDTPWPAGHRGASTGIDFSFAGLRVLGTIDRTYVVAEGPDGLVLIDQHAAHERVVFEHLLRRGQRAPVPRQTLSVPLPVELDAASMQAWLAYQERMHEFGFIGETFGPRTILLREVPWLYRRAADAAIFRDLLDALVATGGRREELEADLAQRTLAACKAAVKAHDELSPDEIAGLLRELGGCDNPYTCPHGRPTFLVVTLSELQRHFKRTG